MRVLKVSELNRYVKTLFDRDRVLTGVTVKGEISNFKAASSGHYYFTLKDEFSSLRTVMFRSRGRSVSFRPENGMSVLVQGYISVYERDGAYQLYAEGMEPEGAGALHLAFEQLKDRLRKEGLFDQSRKKALPRFPRRIGLVTSPTGAAVRDMVEILRRRWSGLNVILAPVLVQGADAPEDIAKGIRLLNRFGQVDLIITGRGGGSLEDLWAFNSEIVARSIFESGIPVISAVGHETDFTIADFVADFRAATPSAAAEMAVPDKREVKRFLQITGERLYRSVVTGITSGKQRLTRCLTSRVYTKPVEVLCGTRRQQVDFLDHRLVAGMEKLAEKERNQLASLAARLNTASPLATLARGYSVCTRVVDEAVITEASHIPLGDSIKLRLHRGTLYCQVEDKSD